MAYYEGRKPEETKKTPFMIVCNDCGSHDVTVNAFDYATLEIRCDDCGELLCCGTYNEERWRTNNG